ncbi:MAG: hypothetical protein J07HX5_00029 [halophilic archaeon J07HX5]|nr:MAG: hypothetical protein J07HX5_00029 [halophilic archaeon J07HX5]
MTERSSSSHADVPEAQQRGNCNRKTVTPDHPGPAGPAHVLDRADDAATTDGGRTRLSADWTAGHASCVAGSASAAGVIRASRIAFPVTAVVMPASPARTASQIGT